MALQWWEHWSKFKYMYLIRLQWTVVKYNAGYRCRTQHCQRFYWIMGLFKALPTESSLSMSQHYISINISYLNRIKYLYVQKEQREKGFETKQTLFSVFHFKFLIHRYTRTELSKDLTRNCIVLGWKTFNILNWLCD